MIEAPANQWKRGRLINLVVMNLIPLYGVLFLHWDAKLLILSYFIETILLVLFHTFRLWFVHRRWGQRPAVLEKRKQYQVENGANNLPPSFLPIFLLVFYGIFIFVQMMILGGFAERAFPNGIFQASVEAIQGKLSWVLVAFSVMQISTLISEVISQKYSDVPAEELAFLPFRRILVQQLTVILGGFVVMFGGGTAYLFVMVLVNLSIDLLGLNLNHPRVRAAIVQGDADREKAYEELKKVMRE